MDLSPCVSRVIAKADSYIAEHHISDPIARAAVAIDFFYCFERGDEPQPDRDVPQIIRHYLAKQVAEDAGPPADEDLVAALQEIIWKIDHEQPLGNGHALREIARIALERAAEGSED